MTGLRVGIKLTIIVSLLSISQMLKAQSRRLGDLGFLSLPTTTKGLALGGLTTTAIANDIALSLESPALFGKEQNGQLSLSYMNMMKQAHFGSIAYGRELGKRGAWSVGSRFLSYGRFDGRDIYGKKTGDFTVMDFMFQTAYSHELTDYLRVGISIKGVYSATAEYKRYALASDLGLNYFTEDNERSIGLSIHNLGAVFTPYLDRQSYATPWDIRLGFSQRLSHAPFQIHLTAYHLRPQFSWEFTPKNLSLGRKILRHLLIGVEYVPNKNFWLAVGLNPRIMQDFKALRGTKLSGFSCGVGFNQANYRVALAVRAYDSSFWALMATFSTDFGLFNRM